MDILLKERLARVAEVATFWRSIRSAILRGEFPHAFQFFFLWGMISPNLQNRDTQATRVERGGSVRVFIDIPPTADHRQASSDCVNFLLLVHAQVL
jgi:hypothetical protein